MKHNKKDSLSKKTKLTDTIIEFSNVGKKYIVHHEKPTLAENISRVLSFRKTEEFWVFREMNLRIYKGEKIGIYGPNGAGKTTILKMIAGISSPTEGVVTTKGRIISLIDLEAGFHPDLSGQDNIFLNGLVLGMTRQEIISNLKAIIEFADIGNFITAPLYTYSSGMKLRLGFSVAIHAQPDILLLDEVINMGDTNFQEKCLLAMKDMFLSGVTIVVVSQWLSYLEKNTDRIIILTK